MIERLYVHHNHKKHVWYCTIADITATGGNLYSAFAKLTKYPEKFRGAKRCKTLRNKIMEGRYG